MKTGRALATLYASLMLIAANCKAGIQVMVELCQIAINRKGMSVEWEVGMVVPISARKIVTSRTATAKEPWSFLRMA